MKNLQVFVERDDVHGFVKGLWKTDLFRDSHNVGGFIFALVDEFAWTPRFFAEMSNGYLERAHFSTWWNVIMLRDDYTNPFIHDLYLLHEMYHAMRMPYIKDIGIRAFDEKMQRNELEASVLSEIVIYFELPELRRLSFDHEIYADRFLDDPDIKALWSANKIVAIETIRSVRRDVMTSKPEHMLDLTEQWIRRFDEQNAIWRLTWSDRYREVENHMADFQKLATHDRPGAANFHRQWLEKISKKDIPFRQEAELFATFYWANKKKYQAAMERAS